MRDRLSHLHQMQTDSDGFSTVKLDKLSVQEAAAASPPDQDLDGVLQEAHRIRLEIQLIQSDISELKGVNYQALNKTSYPTASKHDSSTIGADIKRRAEAVLHQLHMLNAVRGELEAQRGRSDPVARIARTQYQCLSKDLQEVMFSYNDTEINHREACKRQIQRQMEVVGREVSEEELEEMLHSEELNVFSGQLQGQTVHSAFVQIESRHKELLGLEKRITEIQELFLDVAVLTEEQGAAMENIQKNVQDTEMTVQDGGAQLVKAITYDKDHPFKKLFCGCFPCYNSR